MESLVRLARMQPRVVDPDDRDRMNDVRDEIDNLRRSRLQELYDAGCSTPTAPRSSYAVASGSPRAPTCRTAWWHSDCYLVPHGTAPDTPLLDDLAGVDVDSLVEFVVKDLHAHGPRERALRARSQQRAVATGNRTVDKSVLERPEEVQDDDDPLRPFVGLASGVLAGFLVWALLGAAVLAAYQLTPSWVAATVQTLLVAAR